VHALPEDDDWITERYRAVGDHVREARRYRNLSQEDLYLTAGISRGTLQSVEAGRSCTLATLLRIARALDVPLADLVR
jgi:DNA-binding XRE family transcriptional regulator